MREKGRETKGKYPREVKQQDEKKGTRNKEFDTRMGDKGQETRYKRQVMRDKGDGRQGTKDERHESTVVWQRTRDKGQEIEDERPGTRDGRN
jgi:hypothetical protein